MRELLNLVLEIAISAGDAILEIYQNPSAHLAISEKMDSSPLTAADMASHNLIVNALSKISVLPILSEESASIPWAQRQTWARYWLIDPLDGTKEFIKRNGEFTVNIALIDGHQAVLGVVVAPVFQRAYFAAKDLGAMRQDFGQQPYPIRVVPRKNPWRVVGSRSHLSDSMANFLQQLDPVALVEMGSSLKLCVVAEGTADLYPRLAPTAEWDTAAAQCIVEQAGGCVLNEQLQPLLYNSKENLLNPHFIACGALDKAWSGFFSKQN
jgi:3'(2'), 5'-bisphosphate nucleotidase